MGRCSACKKPVSDTSAMKCSSIGCNNVYHHECLGNSKSNFSKQSLKYKSSWKCPDACTLIAKDDNSNTPVRSIYPEERDSDDNADNSPGHGTAVIDQNILDYLDKKFDSMQDNYKKNVSELLLPIQCELKTLSDRLLKWETRLDNMETELQKQQEITSKLDTVNNEFRSRLSDFHKRLNDIDQSSRSCNIEIQNVPFIKNENLVHVVQNIGNAIKVEIPVSEIRAVHRVALAGKQSDRPRNIVLQLTTRCRRDELLHAARVRRNLTTDLIGIDASPPRRFYVNEHLNLFNKILYGKVRKAASEQSYKYVWVRNCCIFARKTDNSKVIQFRDECDLAKIA